MWGCQVNTPQRIQLRRVKGWRLPFNTIVVRRPTKWGNQFDWQIHGKAEATRLHREWLLSEAGRPMREAARRELGGKNVACTCKLSDTCHGENWLAVANKGEA